MFSATGKKQHLLPIKVDMMKTVNIKQTFSNYIIDWESCFWFGELLVTLFLGETVWGSFINTFPFAFTS